MAWKINAFETSGLRLSGACVFYFWTGAAAWVAALIAALYAEFSLRVPDPPGAYLLEAILGCTGPFVLLALANHYSINEYLRVWADLMRPGWAPQMLDMSAVERIRNELRTNPLLRWLRPPLYPHVGAQLMTAALWYTAVALHPSRGFWARYGEWTADTLSGGFLLGTVFAMSGYALSASGSSVPWLVHVLLLLAAGSLAVLGFSVIRFAARRQALLDYFNTWRLDSLE